MFGARSGHDQCRAAFGALGLAAGGAIWCSHLFGTRWADDAYEHESTSMQTRVPQKRLTWSRTPKCRGKTRGFRRRTPLPPASSPISRGLAMNASGLGDPRTNEVCVTSRVTGVNGHPHRPAAALTIARMPALIASASLGLAAKTLYGQTDSTSSRGLCRDSTSSALGIDRPRLGMIQDFAKVQEVLLRGGSLRASRLPPFVNESSGVHGSGSWRRGQ